MKLSKITHQRLQYLLANWGAWEACERVGPMISSVCGSAERAYVMNPRRQVWDVNMHVPRETPDDADLAEKTEKVLLRLDHRYQQVIVFWYARRLSLEDISVRMRMSRVSAEAILDAALVAVMSELEEMSWANGL